MSDQVNKPSHYIGGRKYEPIDVIQDWDLGFCLGNALKYISRAGRKDPEKTLEDLRKAQWYVNRAITELEEPDESSYSLPYSSHTFDLYGEILKAQPSDLGYGLRCPGRLKQSLEDHKLCTAWDSDDSYMIETKHSEHYYDVNRNRAYDDWTVDDCGWDPTTGPTC